MSVLAISWRKPAALATLALFAAGPGPAAAQETSAPPRPGWLGVWIQCDDCRVMQGDSAVGWRFTQPPTVISVVEGSPAERAGLQSGDTLVRIDGVDLTAAPGGRRFGEVHEGRPITFVARRDGVERTVRVVPGRRPADWPKAKPELKGELKVDSVGGFAHADSMLPRLRQRLDSLHLKFQTRVWTFDSLRPRDLEARQEWMVIRDSILIKLDSLAVAVLTPRPGAAMAPAPAPGYAPGFWLGDSVAAAVGWNVVAGAEMTALRELREFFPGAEGGVLVLHVLDGTPAARAGLRPGDVIVEVRGRPVSKVEDVRRAFKPYYEPVQCEVVRKGKKVNVTIRASEERPGRGPSYPFSP